LRAHLCRRARALAREWPGGYRPRLLAPNEAGRTPKTTSAIFSMVALHWREMELWLPDMREWFLGVPRVVLADLRLAGMFSSVPYMPLCTLVASGSPPEALWSALRLLRHVQVGPPAALLSGSAVTFRRPRMGCGHAGDDSRIPMRLRRFPGTEHWPDCRSAASPEGHGEGAPP
jgi:hypothetical protein